MDKVGFKYSSLDPKAGTFKANEPEASDDNKIVSDEYLEDPVGQNTTEALNDLLGTTEAGDTDAQVNAFGIQINDNSSVSVPGLLLTIDEIYAKASAAGISIGLSELSQIEKMYKEADDKLSGVRAKLIEKIESGTLTASDTEIARQQLEIIDKSFAIREEALKEIPALRAAIEANIKAEYAKFMEMAAGVAKKYNEGSAEERSAIVDQLMTCDIDGNGIIGENIKILTNTSVGSVLWDMDAEKPVKRIAASGAPITSKLYDPSYKWTMSDSLKMEGKQAGGRATFEVKSDPKSESIDLVVPDYIACYVDENGELKETTYEGETYLCATGLESEGGKIIQKTPENGKRVQHVRIARVEVFSEEIESNPGKYDLKYRLYTADQQIAFEGTIKGSNGYSASDYRVNIVSDLKMLDGDTSLANASGLSRTEPVVIDAKGLISTCRYKIGDELYNRILEDYDIDLAKMQQKNSNARDVFEKNLKEMYNSGTYETVNVNSANFKTEAMGPVVMGFGSATVYGSETSRNLVLFSKNDQSMKPVEGSSEDVNPLASKIFVGDDNYNIVISDKTGNLRASGVTLAYKDSGSLKTNDAVSVTNVMGITGSNQADMYDTVNVPVFVALTGRGTKMIDNESDMNENNLNGKGEPDPLNGYGDDCFIGDTISYSIPQSAEGKVGDPDASTMRNDGALDPSAIASEALKFEDAVEGLDDLEDNAEKYYNDIKPEGEVMNQTDAELDAFFADVASVFGQTDQWLNDTLGTESAEETLEEELAKKASEEAK